MIFNRYTSTAFLDSQKCEEETETEQREFPRLPSIFAQVQQPTQSSGNFGVTFFAKGKKINFKVLKKPTAKLVG
ncbi:MAG: hypothetical protein A2Z42_01815 [Candidatus Woykebacteria bacterium RBG_19FT_COMBO_43_10]|uniref:Uncharacterized protein n=1 Tax=Candidatus Woykebacteria bacterium RBG_19FT_COMBO_43_10 TaxID=1802598 RepID=A0A1G1WKP8_9BACT|nr:MAG: hypothetical protein A2Z42_01815 [Candidatus Woykebacteria bacterium RBG_19FT_COMBO_43_10]